MINVASNMVDRIKARKTARPARKEWNCSGNHTTRPRCSRLMISERQHGPAAAPLMCHDPYKAGNRAHNNPCNS